MDLDDFERVNDTFGHVVGDTVLRAVTRTLQAAALGTDSVARWGGDEFVAICPTADVPALREIGRRMLALLHSASIDVGDVRVGARVSIGGAMAQAGDDPASLFVRADEAPYRSKLAGRDRATVLEPGDERRSPGRAEGISSTAG